MRRVCLVLGTVLLWAGASPAQGATMSVHLTDPPVVGREHLTVRITVTGAARGDQYELYLTRSGCPDPRFIGAGAVPTGNATFNSRAVHAPPPFNEETLTAPGAYTICGYLGHNNFEPNGAPLPPTITARAAEHVTAREAVMTLELGWASYNERARRLRVSLSGFTETQSEVALYLTKLGATCPKRRPRPGRAGLEYVTTAEFKVGSNDVVVHATKNHGSPPSGRHRICAYLAAGAPGRSQASASGVVKIGGGGNLPPEAEPDHWAVQAGLAVDENLLANDSDPDGDKITARILEISFASKEWSGLDRDGGFLYTAGPGTRNVLRKKITYQAVDSHGARSEPVVSIVRVIPTKEQPTAVPSASGRAVAAEIPTTGWDGPWEWRGLCFGSGLKTHCYTMVSVARAAELAGITTWTPTPANALRMCTRYGLLPIKAATCAKKLAVRTLPMIWDTAIVRGVAGMGDCLLFETRRHRTLRHPVAGEWSTPEYHPTYSYTRPYNQSFPHVTGWGRWNRGLTGTYKLPLVCESTRKVWGRPHTDLDVER